jgi:hypothetical protein
MVIDYILYYLLALQIEEIALKHKILVILIYMLINSNSKVSRC